AWLSRPGACRARRRAACRRGSRPGGAMIARRVCRWTAIALAAAAIVDPRVPFPHRERPPVRLVTGQDQAARAPLNGRLRPAGFAIAAEGESAAVVDASARITPWPSAPPTYGGRCHV